MFIGRKIFFDQLTGNIILDTGEKSGDVIETTVTQDFASYRELSERVPSTVGVISCVYGQESEKFGVYSYHVDIATNTLVWGEPIDSAVIPVAPIEQQINDLKNDNLILMEVLATIYEEMMVKGTV